MNATTVIATIFTIVLVAPVLAEDTGNQLSPTIITHESGDSAPGLDFNYKKTFFEPVNGTSEINGDVTLPAEDATSGGPTLPNKDVLKEGFFSAKGSVSLNSDVLPKELISLGIGYRTFHYYDNSDFLGVFDVLD